MMFEYGNLVLHAVVVSREWCGSLLLLDASIPMRQFTFTFTFTASVPSFRLA